MSNYALIKDGIVENIVLWNGEDNLFSEYDVINVNDVEVAIGWQYSNGEFLAPPEPEKSKEELTAEAEYQKRTCIDYANDYINGRQWPGKAALGRLKEAEKEQYNLWLDYLDALEAVDTSSAPDINWPVAPEE